MQSIAIILSDATSQGWQIQQLAENFGVDTPFLLAQILNFCVVASLIYFFGFKPVLKTVDERQKKISDGLQYAEEMKTNLANAQKQASQKLEEAAVQSQNILQEAKENAHKFEEQKKKDAISQAEATLKKAKESIEIERQKTMDEARTEIANLVVVASAKVLGKALTEEEAKRFNSAAAQSIQA